MRTTLAVAFLVIALACTASAQISFGFKGGLDMAKLSGDGWDDAAQYMESTVDDKSLTGAAFGVVMAMPLGKGGFSLQPEVLYVMKGAEADITNPDLIAEGYDDVSMKLKQNYLEVPVLIKYTFPTQGSISPNLFAGPFAAINLSSELEWVNAPPEAAEELGEGDIENAASVDFGLTFGGGVSFAVGPKGKLTLDVRYTLGMAGIFDDLDGEEENGKLYLTDENDEGLDFKNQDIRVMVGFFF